MDSAGETESKSPWEGMQGYLTPAQWGECRIENGECKIQPLN
jgi:hypothetical protein